MSERPDKQKRKEMLHAIRAKERAEARAKLPMSDELMKSMFDMLDNDFPRVGCNHTLRLVEAWAAANQVDVNKLTAWCRDNGGFCDCEVLANCEEHWQNAVRDVNW
jgi:hypothetical protein